MNLIELNKNDYKKFTNSHNAHFLESCEWGEVASYQGYKVFYLGLINNNNILATALVLERKLLFNYSKLYIPRGYTIDYKNKELLRIMTCKLKEFAKKKKAIFLKIDPAIKLHTIDSNARKIKGDNNYDIVKKLEDVGFIHLPLTKYFETSQPRYTFRIPLENSLECIKKNYSNSTISRINKAKEYGVYVEIGNHEDINEFSRLMELTEKRQGFYSHNKEYFSKFYEIFNKSNMVTLYLAKIDLNKLFKKLKTDKDNYLIELNKIKDINSKKINNRKKEIAKNLNTLLEQIKFLENKPKEIVVISSYLVVKYNNIAWALYAANDMDYKSLFANYLIYDTQIEDSFKEGVKIFDVFGTIGDPNSNSHLVGLHDFKKKWGGEYIEFIGEFDLVLNEFIYFLYKKLIPIYHKIVNIKLKKEVK